MSKRKGPPPSKDNKRSKNKSTETKEEEKSWELVLNYIKLTTSSRNNFEDVVYFQSNVSLEKKQIILNELEEILETNRLQPPYIIKLLDSKLPKTIKTVVFNKLIQIKNGHDHGGKLEEWVNAFFKIPFDCYIDIPVTISDGSLKCKEFIEQCEKTLNECTYGMKNAKNQILQLIGKWIVNPSSMGTAIALKGPMGTGKTTLIKHGISKILNRPFAFITLGGASDGNYLSGHSFTYEGSMYGKMIDILIQTKCNNPVIFFDELDKISQNGRGDEVTGILTHLTDTTQNSQFHDNYFSEIDFDMSKCLFMFSYNDESNVNRILRDRMYVIEVDGYTKKEKIRIALDYLLPEIFKEFNMPKKHFTEEVVEYIIDHIEKEEGVRCLKRSLETICSKMNLKSLSKDTNETSISIDDINKMLNLKSKEKHYSSMYL
jgi:ATP-dependent Lon protease